MPDAISLLKTDHKNVKALFREFERAKDPRQRRQLVGTMIQELSVHAAIEEHVFYPTARRAVPDADDVVLESLEEHHIVKWTLSELDGMDPGDERFDAKVRVLMESVKHHIDEEESELFPKVREQLGRKALTEIGELMMQAKELAPAEPQPRMPDEPPGNMRVGPMAGLADRIQELIGRIESGDGDGRARPGTSRTATAARTGSRSGGGSTSRSGGGSTSRTGSSRTGGSASRSGGSASRTGGSTKRASAPRSGGSTSRTGGSRSTSAKSGGSRSTGGSRTSTKSRG